MASSPPRSCASSGSRSWVAPLPSASRSCRGDGLAFPLGRKESVTDAAERSSVLVIGLPFCFTGRALLTGKVYAPIDVGYLFEPLASLASKVGVEHVANPALSDVYAQFLPWNAALRWAVEHRQWPLWNPFELCGNVLAAAAQSAPYHPLTLLGVLLPMPEALTFAATAMYFIAALGAFLLIRSIQDGPS